MTHDRNYLRMMHDVELTRYARDVVTTDLEIVLLERLWGLMGAVDDLEAAKAAIKDISRRCDILTEELNTLENDQ